MQTKKEKNYGFYKTDERALEILDEIQNKLMENQKRKNEHNSIKKRRRNKNR